MDIPQEIMEIVHENKYHVLLLGLSTFAVNRMTYEMRESKLYYGEEEIGKYYYQLEPIILFCSKRNIRVDCVMMISTKDTKIAKTVKIGETVQEISEAEYFEQFVHKTLGDKVKTTVVEEGKSDVETIRKVIEELRAISDAEVRVSVDIHGGLRKMQLLLTNMVSLLQHEKIDTDKAYTVQYDNKESKGVLEPVNSGISQFTSGMNEFFLYGRSLSLEEYYSDRDDNLGGLIKAVSDSIQLCDISAFDRALSDMKKYVESYESKGDYTDIFIDTIKTSYGRLLTDGANTIDKIKWCLDNDFIQQALTIIESKMSSEFIPRMLNYKTKDGQVTVHSENGATGLADLMDFLIDAKKNRQNWETPTNFAFNEWLREVIKIRNINNITTSKISGKTRNNYLTEPINEDEIRLWGFKRIERGDNKKEYINLEFKVTKEVMERRQEDNLKRLLKLHKLLKDERNQANHGIVQRRASCDDVRTAISAYVELAQKVFNQNEEG